MGKQTAVFLWLCLGLWAFAQSPKPFAGASLVFQWVEGTPLTSLMLQAGSYNLGSGFGARANVGIGLSPSFLELGADLLFPFGTGRLLPYGGFGGNWVGLGVLNFFGIRGLAGVNYSTASDTGLFAEAVPTLYLASDATGIYGTAFGIQIRFGVNYLF
ncbi:hypothetical protein [Meiothermus sp.]|jgi:hypothetical protein|uniref:hypothetical protein n=1 Tax=Meiothermus sp. TaxID=1955249 RepID=UPI0021DCDDBD|nr:hypothetical protein [Meiothermus sp.]GIW25642.1 MAG: hypothetical protein KatS3mg069_1909 [Meiothermus sp.]